jgi:ribosome-binding factor A
MRKERIASLLQSEIASVLLRTVNDHRIGLISITEVKLSKDFRSALIFYSQIGNEEQKEITIKALKSATPFIHSEVSKQIRYMQIPKLRFQFDSRLEKNMILASQIRQQKLNDDHSLR